MRVNNIFTFFLTLEEKSIHFLTIKDDVSCSFCMMHSGKVSSVLANGTLVSQNSSLLYLLSNSYCSYSYPIHLRLHSLESEPEKGILYKWFINNLWWSEGKDRGLGDRYSLPWGLWNRKGTFVPPWRKHVLIIQLPIAYHNWQCNTYQNLSVLLCGSWQCVTGCGAVPGRVYLLGMYGSDHELLVHAMGTNSAGCSSLPALLRPICFEH